MNDLQLYLLKNMQRFERYEEYGVSVFSWATKLECDNMTVDLPGSFGIIDHLRLPHVCAWVDLENTSIAIWRKVPVLELPLVNMYRFDNHSLFRRELEDMIRNPQKLADLD